MTANRPFDDDDRPSRGYVERRSDPNRSDREISLGTPTILGIFFAIAIAFAVVFGLGYTMGRRSAQTTVAAVDPATGLPVSSTTKPSADGTSTRPVSAPTPQADPATAAPAETATIPLNPPSTPATAPANPPVATAKPSPPAPQPTNNNQPPTTSYVVQIAAVSTQEIADIEVAALKKQGFDVIVRHEPQDKLLHVQIGPFTDKKEAEAMRARVLADGFNAIVK